MVLAVLLVIVLLAVPARAQADGRYVALGDSVAAMSVNYVQRFGDWLRVNRGITDVRNVAVGGETSASILGRQLHSALSLIGDGTDTKVVTLDIGGNDYLNHTCSRATWNTPSCPFADNLASVLGSLRAALDADPGQEQLLVMSYYNPASGLGTATERDIDAGLFGTDARIDTLASGAAIGMADIIGWEACHFGATLVDAWPAFKVGGQSLILDGTHPNAAGQDVLASLFEDPAKGGPTPPCPATAPFATTQPDAGDGMLRGVVESRLTNVRWWFDYGPTTSYGSSTPPQDLPAAAGARGVHTPLPAASGTFHVRLVATNDHGRVDGGDQVVVATGANGSTGTTGGGSPIPDFTPPRLSISVARSQRLGRSVAIAVTCRDEPCTVWVAGNLRARGRTYPLLSTAAPLAARRRRTLRLALTAGARAAARAALRAHRRVQVTLLVTARDRAGNDAVAGRVVTLR